MRDLTLIQLVSEQTIQNLLPALRLRPARLVHLVTPRTARRSANIENAARAAGLAPHVETIPLSAMPGIQETFGVVNEAITRATGEGGKCVVNFTGGTKLMSIGAYAAARTHHVPSLYVDTADSMFMDGGTSAEMGELLEGDWSFTPLRKDLRVDVLSIANGVQRVTNGRDWRPYLPLALHIFDNGEEEENLHQAIHGQSGLVPGGKEPRTPEGWIELLEQPLDISARVGELAAEAGLLRGGPDGKFFLPDQTRSALELLAAIPDYRPDTRYFRAVEPLQQALGFLAGAWWEIIVADAMHRSGQVRDLRWSVQAGERGGGANQEEDLLGISGVELVYVSCKRTSDRSRLISLLDEIKSRASALGGNFNRKFLAVRHPPTGRAWENLLGRAEERGIQIITPDNLHSQLLT
jgi:hypothetical protein